TTNGSGQYVLTVTAGPYAFEASSPGFAPATQMNTTVSDGGTVAVNLVLSAVAPTDISYVYDELGRLVAVTDATGDTATYGYDAVGNILSIARQGSNAVSIVEVTPNAGVSGTPVRLFGTGFSASPSQDSVSFNGLAAVVSTATATQLTVSVPTGATSGVVAVVTPSGSATSSGAFIVDPGSGPTITGISPTVATAGTPLTVMGRNFQTTSSNNAVSVNVSAAAVTTASETTLGTSVPSMARSGHVSVTTPFGGAISSEYVFVAPAPYSPADVGMAQPLLYETPTTA